MNGELHSQQNRVLLVLNEESDQPAWIKLALSLGAQPETIFLRGMITVPADKSLSEAATQTRIFRDALETIAQDYPAIYEQAQVKVDFLQEIYGPLRRWHEWWVTYNSAENSLCEYRHPFSSGLDDSPLWDKGMPVVAPDLNTYLCIQLESLAHIAELIGEDQDVAQYRADAQAFRQRMVDYLWDDHKGVFNATYENQPIDVLTPFSLLPLWAGNLPTHVVESLLAHLTNPDEFWVKYPIPTVAVNDPALDAWQMWRGPTWINVNYLFVEALNKIGQHDLAKELRLKALDLLMQHEDIYEYYHPITGERPPKAAPIFGWSAALFIDLVIQETEAQGSKADKS